MTLHNSNSARRPRRLQKSTAASLIYELATTLGGIANTQKTAADFTRVVVSFYADDARTFRTRAYVSKHWLNINTDTGMQTTAAGYPELRGSHYRAANLIWRYFDSAHQALRERRRLLENTKPPHPPPPDILNYTLTKGWRLLLDGNCKWFLAPAFMTWCYELNCNAGVITPSKERADWRALADKHINQPGHERYLWYRARREEKKERIENTPCKWVSKIIQTYLHHPTEHPRSLTNWPCRNEYQRTCLTHDHLQPVNYAKAPCAQAERFYEKETEIPLSVLDKLATPIHYNP